MSESSKRNNPIKGSTVVNLASNVLFLGVNTLIGIFIVPFLITKLGVDAYGIIPLANNFVQYFTLATLALNSSVGRYITLAMERGNLEDSIRIFNTTFWGNILVILGLFLLCAPVVGYLDKLINLPVDKEGASRYLFICVFLGFFITIATSSFAISTWCLNRFDLRNFINLLNRGSYLLLILLFFTVFQSNLAYVGVAILVSAIITAIMNVVVSYQLMPHLVLSIRYFDRSSLRKLLSTGGWIFVNKIGSILYLNVDLLVINRLLGTFQAGQYASLLQWVVLIRMLAMAMSCVFGPPLVYRYAQGDKAELASYSRRAVRCIGLGMALPIGLIAGFAAPLLAVWLGEEFAELSGLLVLMVLPLCINVAVYPLFELQIAANKVRLPGIVTFLMGVGNLGLAIFLCGWTPLGMYGVALASAWVLTLKNTFFTPIYGAYIIGEKWYSFLKDLIGITISAIGVFGVAITLEHLLNLAVWVWLGGAAFLIGTGYCVVIWLLLPGADRRLATEYVVGFMQGKGIGYVGR